MIPRFTFHFWAPYLPKFKLLIIFRDLLVAANSYVKFKRDEISFLEVLSRWLTYYQRILYYFGRYGGLAVRYEDLIDVSTRDRVMQRITEFVGKKPAKNIASLVKLELSHCNLVTQRLKNCFPIPLEIKRVLENLEQLKV